MGRIAGVTAEETRQRLLDAATAEFLRRGFEGTRVADIAAGAELSNGALYGHFRSKSELLAAALKEGGAKELEALFLGATGQSIADLLAAIGRGLMRIPSGPGDLMVEALVAARRDPEAAEVTSRHIGEGQSWLIALIQEGQREGTVDVDLDPEALARFCVIMLLGSMLLSAVELPTVAKAGWADLIQRIEDSVTNPAAE
jgi:AcrR family transcriptional regulator